MMLTTSTYNVQAKSCLVSSGSEAGRSWSLVGSDSLFSKDGVMGLERGHKYIQAPATTNHPRRPV